MKMLTKMLKIWEDFVRYQLMYRKIKHISFGKMLIESMITRVEEKRVLQSPTYYMHQDPDVDEPYFRLDDSLEIFREFNHYYRLMDEDWAKMLGYFLGTREEHEFLVRWMNKIYDEILKERGFIR